jgi:hypothetical protein
MNVEIGTDSVFMAAKGWRSGPFLQPDGQGRYGQWTLHLPTLGKIRARRDVTDSRPPVRYTVYSFQRKILIL